MQNYRVARNHWKCSNALHTRTSRCSSREPSPSPPLQGRHPPSHAPALSICNSLVFFLLEIQKHRILILTLALIDCFMFSFISQSKDSIRVMIKERVYSLLVVLFCSNNAIKKYVIMQSIIQIIHKCKESIMPSICDSGMCPQPPAPAQPSPRLQMNRCPHENLGWGLS